MHPRTLSDTFGFYILLLAFYCSLDYFSSNVMHILSATRSPEYRSEFIGEIKFFSECLKVLLLPISQ
jgi:hypothetical protein